MKNKAAAPAPAAALDWREGMMARAASGAQAPISGFRLHRALHSLALLVVATAMLGVLAGCSETGNGDGATRAVGSAGLATVGTRAIERDVEAPEIFSMEEPGLWDGRPSLGGVWIAHPEATNPERVMIRNQQTGETVVGALFRRERENPGPRFQISSEAANALNILPGQPTTVRVVALQLQRIEPEPAPESPARTAQDTTRDATAQSDSAADTGTEAAQTAAAAAQTEPTDEPRGLRRLFSRRSDTRDEADGADIAVSTLPESGTTPSAGSAAQSAVATATAAGAAAEARSAPRERRGLAALFSRGDRANQPEDSAQADALIPLPEDTTRDGALSPLAASTPASPPASTLDRPFVQIGIFSVEANATGARERMQRAGLDAEIRRGQMNDNQFWRVVVGPAQDRAGQAAILEQVRAMGFGDAYTVAR